MILLFKTNQNGTFESCLFRQACAVRNEDFRYEFTGKNFAVQPLCRACAFLLKQRIEVVCIFAINEEADRSDGRALALHTGSKTGINTLLPARYFFDFTN